MEQEFEQEQELANEQAADSEQINLQLNEQLQSKEQYSKVLIGKVQQAIKVIKILVSVAGGLAAVLLVFGILAVTVIKDTHSAIIGFLVILGVVAAVFVAVIAMFVYAKIHLTKLRKLN